MKALFKSSAVFMVLACTVGILYGGFVWTVNRVYVPQGHSLQLRYKGPLLFGDRKEAKAGHFAEEGEIGVLAKLRGPGRHFYCPIWWEREVIEDFVVPPGHVAVVTSKLGDSLPQGEFLVDGDLGSTHQKGILRKVFGPGRYRANPYAYVFNVIQTKQKHVGKQTKNAGWVSIPTGYAGVITYKTDNKAEGIRAGIYPKVLPPGLYPINPHEAEVDIVEIGLRESSIRVTKKKDRRGNVVLDESGEPIPVAETGINFPSNEAFEIQMDFTAVWGVMPKNAPHIVSKFGNVDAVEQKVILPQSESICRNSGSKYSAVELLVGESRQKFQNDTSREFREVLQTKGISLQYGLVRHIYIPLEIRLPIQRSFIADELKLTRDQEQETAKTEANLREAEKKVDLEAEKIRVETTKMIANIKAEGDKTAREIEAETKQLVAAIDKKAAELDAKRTVVLGQADATSQRLSKEAVADKFRLAVAAFGDPAAYTQWQFAEGLPDDIDLSMIYAGEGTLWTDLKKAVPTVPLREPKSRKTRNR